MDILKNCSCIVPSQLIFFMVFFRLVEEVKEKAGVSLENEDVFMATTFQEFIQVGYPNIGILV